MKESSSYLIPVVINLIRYFAIAGSAFLVFYKLYPKFFLKNKIQNRKATTSDFKREILHSLQSTFILVVVGLVVLQTPLRNYTHLYSDIEAYPIWWIPVSILLSFVIHDTYFYWMHRSVHHPKLFKPIHLLHHKSISPSPWASYSFHFSEALLEAMIAPLIFILIPIHPISFVIFTFVSFIINVYGHLGYEIAPKWLRNSILFETIVTSTYHNLHHEKFKVNYGLYFRFWDRLMKTEHPDYQAFYDEIQRKRFGDNAKVVTKY